MSTGIKLVVNTLLFCAFFTKRTRTGPGPLEKPDPRIFLEYLNFLTKFDFFFFNFGNELEISGKTTAETHIILLRLIKGNCSYFISPFADKEKNKQKILRKKYEIFVCKGPINI